MTAVAEGKLTLEAIQECPHDNPIRIFGVSEQSHTQVEVVVNRKTLFAHRKSKLWSPVDRAKLTGAVNCVAIYGQIDYLHSALTSVTPLGRDISSTMRTAGDRGTRLSVSGPRPTNVTEQPSALNILLRTVCRWFDTHATGSFVFGRFSTLGGAVTSPNVLVIASTARVFPQLTLASFNSL